MTGVAKKCVIIISTGKFDNKRTPSRRPSIEKRFGVGIILENMMEGGKSDQSRFDSLI